MILKSLEKPQTIQSIERALDVIFAVSRAGETGITEVARELGLHVPTASNIFRTLAWRGVLVNREGRYSIGPALAALGAENSVLSRLPELAAEAVKRLTEATGESAVAFVASGEALELLSFSPASDQLAVHFPRELLASPLGLRSGELLAAYLPPAARRRMVARHVRRKEDREATDRDFAHWEKRFERVREQGYATSKPASPRATVSVAATVRDARGNVVATIGASSPTVRSSAEKLSEMREASVEAARELSRQLGYTE